MSGLITQEGVSVVDQTDTLVQLKSDVTFTKIECGYSHALLIDEEGKIYSYGANLYGQLGIGIDARDKHFAQDPVSIQDINDGLDKVLMIACGAHFSLCYTELGILYYWGMLVPENVNSI